MDGFRHELRSDNGETEIYICRSPAIKVAEQVAQMEKAKAKKEKQSHTSF